jgi:hypothetical protein
LFIFISFFYCSAFVLSRNIPKRRRKHEKYSKKKDLREGQKQQRKKPKKCLRIHWLAHLEMEMKCVECSAVGNMSYAAQIIECWREREALEAGEVYVLRTRSDRLNMRDLLRGFRTQASDGAARKARELRRSARTVMLSSPLCGERIDLIESTNREAGGKTTSLRSITVAVK